ncbi:hypothetical protein SC162_10460, partial [Legionella pneumophila serogroup 1]
IRVNIMSILIKFESLAKQAIFSSNKDIILQSIGLLDTIKAKNNQKIRMTLSNSSEQFADMSRVVR